MLRHEVDSVLFQLVFGDFTISFDVNVVKNTASNFVDLCIVDLEGPCSHCGHGRISSSLDFLHVHYFAQCQTLIRDF